MLLLMFFAGLALGAVAGSVAFDRLIKRGYLQVVANETTTQELEQAVAQAYKRGMEAADQSWMKARAAAQQAGKDIEKTLGGE